MPGRSHLTPVQQEQAVEMVASLLAHCLFKSQIEAAFRQRFGEHYSHRQVARYVTRARALLKERYSAPAEEWGSNISEFLAAKMRDTKVKPGVQLNAARLLMDLHGLTAPMKVEHSGPGGGAIQLEAVRTLLADPKTRDRLLDLWEHEQRVADTKARPQLGAPGGNGAAGGRNGVGAAGASPTSEP